MTGAGPAMGDGLAGRDEQGPALACIGGGHGLSATLTAARGFAGSLTAIVSVADDGGSSGRLRDDLGVLPPGDLRRCITALADPGSILGRALEHRFAGGDLDQHALGNLLLAGLIEHGLPVEDALAEVGRLVGASGTVLPSASVPVTLVGVAAGDSSLQTQVHLQGQVKVQQTCGLQRVEIDPPDPPTPDVVGEAITGADLVLLGPGSLFTSVLAAAIVPGVARPLASTAATRVLVLNLGPQVGETEHLAPDDHVRVARDHGVPFDVVLADPRFAPSGDDVVVRSVGADGRPVHHPARLAAALEDVLRHR